MTKEETLALANECFVDDNHLTRYQIFHFARLVRNAALEEAAAKFEQPYVDYEDRWIVDTILSMKEEA